jgi:hypothetical protein
MRDSYVCTECVEDEDLQAFIETNASDSGDGCTFCGAEGNDVIACRFLDLMCHIEGCIRREYDLAANNLEWEGAEGGWLGADHWDTPDLLRDKIGIGLPRDHEDTLFDAMCSYLEHTDWCVKNPYGESGLEHLQFDWDELTNIAKHHTRFFLGEQRRERDRGFVSERSDPGGFLKQIGNCAIRLELVSTLQAGTSLYRVRFHEGNPPFTSPTDLGPPPVEGAFVSNRMSPPGIVMFYAALDQDTALAETCEKAGGYSIGQFQTLRHLRVLDLTKAPEPPGFFALEPDSREWRRHEAIFFEEFIADLTKSIKRDNRVHLEYVPTQIIIEYFRRRFHADLAGDPLDGVIYPSSRKIDGVAVVLFCDQSLVIGTPEDEFGSPAEDNKWLELVTADCITLSVEEASAMLQDDPEIDLSGFIDSPE